MRVWCMSVGCGVCQWGVVYVSGVCQWCLLAQCGVSGCWYPVRNGPGPRDLLGSKLHHSLIDGDRCYKYGNCLLISNATGTQNS